MRYPITIPLSQFSSLLRRHLFRRATWLVVIVCAACSVLGLHLATREFASERVATKSTPAGKVTVQAAGRARPLFNFLDGRQVSVNYGGQNVATQAIQSGQAEPRALASGDLDGNATPDLIAGYAFQGAGIITIQRGNPEAFAPTDKSVYARMADGFNPDALLPAVETIQVPGAADFVEVGDFNDDGRKDVLVGTRHGGLVLLAGDGQGSLSAAQQIDLPGSLTALAAGQFRAADGKTDVAVGVNGPGGSQVLIYDGARGGLTASPMQFLLTSEASVIRLDGMDDDPFMDAIVGTGDGVLVIHGWGRKESPELSSRVERVSAESDVRGLSLGHYLWDREGRLEIAALSAD